MHTQMKAYSNAKRVVLMRIFSPSSCLWEVQGECRVLKSWHSPHLTQSRNRNPSGYPGIIRRYSLSSVHSDKKWSWKRAGTFTRIQEDSLRVCVCVFMHASSLKLPPSFCTLVENLVHTWGSCVSTELNPEPSPILHSLLFYYVRSRAWDGGTWAG